MRAQFLVQKYAKDPSVRVLVITGNGHIFCAGTYFTPLLAHIICVYTLHMLTEQMVAPRFKQFCTENHPHISLFPPSFLTYPCAGMDLSGQNQKAMGTDAAKKASAFVDFCNLLKNYPLPVIARVNGPALGGGAVLLFLADVRIMVETAYVQFAEVKRGLLPAMISCFIVPSLGMYDIFWMTCANHPSQLLYPGSSYSFPHPLYHHHSPHLTSRHVTSRPFIPSSPIRSPFQVRLRLQSSS